MISSINTSYTFTNSKYQKTHKKQFEKDSSQKKSVSDTVNNIAFYGFDLVKNNKIQISDPALKTQLENFIKDVPKFSFLIGKQQNGVHSFSLDSHTLQNLQKALKYADDANLSDDSKEILKMSILLHDMGKQSKGSSVSDTGHALLSKQYAEKILERFDYPKNKKEKILNLIENHHWFKEFNKGNMSADDVVKMFGEDLPLANIMAKSDLESVSDDFPLTILEPGKKLSQKEYETKMNEKFSSIDDVVTPELIGSELSIGALKLKEDYILDFDKIDKLKIGNVEVDVNDPKLRKLINEIKEGESFAIGCNNPPIVYTDVKYQVGNYSDGVGSHHVVISQKNGEIVITPHKDGVSTIKYGSTKVSTDPVIAKKIDELRHKASNITNETLIVDGKNVQFEILYGTQSGSNKGYYIVNKKTGELFYAKVTGPQSKVELLANKLYEMAGVDVPQMHYFQSTYGKNGTISKYIPDAPPINTANAAVNDALGMHALLANWDAVCSNNTLLTKDGKAVMIDAGGSFDYHAHQGGSKPFTAIPTEVTTLIDKNINAASAEILSKMTREDAIKSFQKVVNLKDSEIKKLLSDMNLKQYETTLLKRKKFIKSMLEEMKAAPQGKDSMLTYMTKVKDKTLMKFIEDAKTLGDLEDIKNALPYVKDETLKNTLIDKINARKKYLETAAPKPQKLSTVQVKNLLAENGFVQNITGLYKKQLDYVTKQQYYNDYGFLGSTIIAKIERPLNSSDIECLKVMLNAADGKYISMWQKDMNALILLYRNIEHSGVFSMKMDSAQWEVIFNIGKSKPVTAAQFEAISFYKSNNGYKRINKALTAQKSNNTPLSPSIKEKVDHIQEYISTQVLNAPIKVWRGEDLEVLASVKTKSGESLDQALKAARKHYLASGKTDKSKINEIINEVLDKNYVAKQERFMSTSLEEKGGFYDVTNIGWELTVQKGSKGVFLEGINVKELEQSECEFLLQKDSEIIITDIDYDYTKNRWILKGSVFN